MVCAEKLREVYEAAGFQGVYDRRGSAGVHELLRAWRPHQRRMKARDGQEITFSRLLLLPRWRQFLPPTWHGRALRTERSR